MRLDITPRQFGSFFDPKTLDVSMRQSVMEPLTIAAKRVEILMANATPQGATGRLRKGWHTEVDVKSCRVAVVNSEYHILPVDLGRRAAFVPIAPLIPWVQMKIEPDFKKARSIAFAISFNKSKKATPGQAFVLRTWNDNKGVIQESLQFMVYQALLKTWA